MRQIDLTHARQGTGDVFALYLADRPSGRLLLYAPSERRNASDVAPSMSVLAAEGWHILYAHCAPDQDPGEAAAAISDALRRAITQFAIHPANQVLAVADGVTVLPVGIAVLQSHRQADLPTISGIAIVDVFEQAPASTERCVSDIAAELAKLDGLATIVASRRKSSEARCAAISYHQQLQALGRETHFVALADDAPSLLERLADPRDPLGREVRWLLNPVHSRSEV